MNEFQKLEQRVKKLESVTNLSQFDLFMRHLFVDDKPADDGAVDTTLTITIGSGGGTDQEQILDFPDGFLRINYNGKLYRIPIYNESRF